MVFDHSGAVVAIDRKEHEQIYPKPGWVEHDPAEIWTRCVEVIQGGLAKAGIKASDLAAVGITNQRETTVVWDRKTGKAVYNAIVWQDTRTDTLINGWAKDGGQDRFRAKVGLPLATYFSGPKVKWILDNVPGAQAKADAGDLIFGNIDTWCIWNLTGGTNGGVHVTNVSNASRTMLMNLEKAVVYFHGCAVNYYEPHVANAAIAILERNGYQVIVPEQVCCGLPLISNGIYGEARERANKNLKILAEYARKGYKIVGTSTSCTHTIKAEYREMLDIRDDDEKVVAEATWDICEFLLDLHEQGKLDTSFGTLDEDLPYHAPCQLRSHGIGLPAMDLFALVPGLRARDMDHDCCGMAGTYGMKKEKYDIAFAVGEPLFEKVRASGAPEAACDSETCRWQIQGATGVRTKHPVEILQAAYLAGDAAAGHPASGRK